jgi:hypothetical protein
MSDETITKHDLRTVTFIITGDRNAIKIDDAPGGGLRVFCDFQAGVESVRVRTRERVEGDVAPPGEGVDLSEIPLSGKDPEGFQERVDEGATREQLLHDVAGVSPTAAAELGMRPTKANTHVSPAASGTTSETVTGTEPETKPVDTFGEQQVAVEGDLTAEAEAAAGEVDVTAEAEIAARRRRGKGST